MMKFISKILLAFNLIVLINAASIITVAAAPPIWYRDLDGDSFGNPGVTSGAVTCPPGYVANNLDCDDNRFHQTIWQQEGNAISSSSLSIKQVFGPDGTPYVLSRNNAANDHRISVFTFSGAAWQLVGSADFSNVLSNDFIRPDMVIDHNGIPYISYFYDNGSPGFYDLYVMKYTGNGATGWELVGSSGFARIADNIKQTIPLAINSNNEVFIAFPDGDNNDSPAVMKYTGSGATGWVAVGASLTVDKSFYLSFTVDGNDNLYVGFQDATDYGSGILGTATVMTFDGISWVPVGTPGFSSGAGGIASNQVVVSPENIPYMIYWDTDGGGNDVVIVKKYDTTLSGWVDVGNNSPVYAGTFTSDVDKNIVSMVFDPAGTPYISYVDNAMDLIVKKLNNNNNWTIVGSAFPGDVYPSLSIGPDKVPYLSYVNATYNAYLVKAVTEVIDPGLATISSAGNLICFGSSITLSITSSNLNGADKWEWYSGTCGGTSLGTGTGFSLTVSPTIKTSYFVRGEGACLSASGTCSGITITVNSAPSISLQPTNTTVCGGNTAFFSTSATGTALTYQWQTDNGTGGSSWNNIAGATVTGLTLAGVNATLNGYRYHSVISGACTPFATTSGAVLTVNILPTVTSAPISTTVCGGNTALFSVTAAGTGLTYQWQTDNGTGSAWANIPGSVNSTLTLTGVSTSMNGFSYRVIASGTCAPPATTSGASLAVNALPTVTSSPISTNACEGSDVIFTSSISGTTAFQWQLNTGTGWNNLAGMTNANLTLSGVSTSANLYQYRVSANVAACATVASNIAVLTVNSRPSTSILPGSIDLCTLSGTTTLQADAGLTYQWQVSTTNSGLDFNDIPGETGLSLNVLAGDYPAFDVIKIRALETNSFGCSTFTGLKTISMVSIPGIVIQPVDNYVCEGLNAVFNVSAVGNNLSYQWAVKTTVSGFYTNITGETNPSLTLTGVNASMDGYYYLVNVTQTLGGCNKTSNQPRLFVNLLPVIVLQPNSLTVCGGNSAVFNVSATGTALTYQWQTDNGSGSVWSSMAGKTTTGLSLTAATSINGFNYRVIVGGTCSPSITSSGVFLTVNSPLIIASQPTASITSCAGSNVSYTVSATGTGLTYQWQTDNGTGTFANIGGATTSILGLTNITSSLSGYNYRAILTGGGVCGLTTLTSNISSLTVNSPLIIASQPTASITSCAGSNVSYTVSATGTGLTYQWQTDNGTGTFANIGGATTSILGLTNITSSLSGYNYRAILTGGGVCGLTTLTSNISSLTVNSPLIIASQPTASITSCAGSNVSYIVSATGTGLTYQWQTDNGTGTFANIGGATTSILGLTNITSSLSGYNYRAILTGGGVCGLTTLTSNISSLTVNSPLIIASQPTASITSCAGSNVSYIVSATGTGLTYQWQTDNGTGTFANIGGATTSILGLTNITSSLSGYNYRAILTGGGVCGLTTLTSNISSLTVNSPLIIASQPAASITSCAGSNVSYTVSATGTGLTYQWQTDNGTGTFANIGGATTSILGLTNITSGLSGYNYRAILTGGGVCGLTTLTSNISSLTVNSPLIIASQPAASITSCAGSNVSYIVSATGTGLTYQWQTDNGTGTFANIGGATTSILGLTNITSSLSGYNYRAILTGGGVCGLTTLTSNISSLTVNSPLIIASQPAASITSCAGSNVSYIVSATGTGLTYQWQTDNGTGTFANIGGATTSILGLTNITSSLSGYNYRAILTGGGVCGLTTLTSNISSLTVNSPLIIASQPTASITSCAGSNVSYIVSATGTGLTYQWQTDNGTGTFANIGGATTSILGLINITSSLSGYNYKALITGGGACGVITLSTLGSSLTVDSPLIIATQPTASITSCAGSNVSYIVSATGTGLTYQWQTDNGTGTFANIGGATTSILGLTNITSSLSGYNYKALITGGGTCGIITLTTSGSSLIVDNPPVIATQPTASITSCAGSNVSYIVSATGTGLTYQWQTDNGTGTFANIGGATTSILGLTNIANSLSGFNYQVIVSGSGACASTPVPGNISSLTVDTSPLIITQPTDIVACEGENINFGISATGTNLSFQWQSDNGGSYTDLAGENNASLALNNISTALNNTNYRVKINSGGVCVPNAITSTGANLTVNSFPVIVGQPSDINTCPGSDIAFAVSATGIGLTYQWQNDNASGGATWADIIGSTTTDLFLTGVDASVNGFRYRAVIAGTCALPLTSSSASLLINRTPVVVISPVLAASCEGGSALFNVSATGVSLSYQWQQDAGAGYVNIVGETGLVLNLNGILGAMDGTSYRAIVTGTCALTSTSSGANLTVIPPPLIITQPPPITNQCELSDLILNVSVSGTALTYQWQVNDGGGWNNISQAVDPVLSLTGITSAMNNNVFRAIIADGGCSVITSDGTSLTIQPLPEVSAGPDKTVNKGELVVLEGSTSAVDPLSYQWMPVLSLNDASILQPVASPVVDTYYTLTLTDQNTCKATDTVLVTVIKNVLKIPNAFSPNGDGVHDRWVIQNLNVYNNCSIQVFNRYGSTVYVSNGYGEWDGTSGGTLLPIGTYYYLIDLKDGTTFTGYVTVL